jgi:hypothetical protein
MIARIRLRRYYRITDAGLVVLHSEIDRLEANAAAGRAQLALRTEVGLA